jgi:sugar lactone lactonase YvrE
MRTLKWVLLVFSVLLLVGTKVNAETGVRYRTFTVSNNRYVPTQTAYVALSSLDLIYGEPLEVPNDIFINDNNDAYIVSTNEAGTSGKIIKFNLSTETVEVLADDFLINPTGVFVNDEGLIFVADRAAKLAYKLDTDGTIIDTYDRPTSPLFGTDDFSPRKIVSDSRGNVYVLNNGTRGLVQYSNTGTFLGYFGTNTIQPSFRTVLQYTFFTEEQRENLFSIAPPEISNMAIDDRGLIHTTSLGVEEFGVKRLNISGDNLLPSMMNELDLVDIFVGPIGNIYTISKSGTITEYDMEGNLLFTFGGQDESNQIKGLFGIPSAIAVDEKYNIYVLDEANQELQIFIPTEFSSLVHTALNLYQEGQYIEAEGPWREVLKMNDLFDLAHQGLGNAYYSLGNYEEALEEYRVSYDRDGYSDAFWEVRNEWLLNNVGNVLAGLFIVLLIYVLNLKLKFMQVVFKPIKKAVRKGRDKSRLLDESLYLFSYLRNPADASFEIKRRNRVGYLSASFVLLVFYALYIIYIYRLGFLFNHRVVADINVVEETMKIFLPFFLWVGSNYLVSSIREGEGRFKDVYITTIFALSPYFLVLPVLTVLSHALTYNEQFLMTALSNVSIGVTAIYFFFMVKETHFYQMKETVVSIFVSFFTMVMVLLSTFIIYILLNELLTLVIDIVMEVIYRV